MAARAGGGDPPGEFFGKRLTEGEPFHVEFGIDRFGDGRKGEPALESWNRSWSGDAPAMTARKPRPVWLLIGLLWLSTALVTVGAVAAIARLAG